MQQPGQDAVRDAARVHDAEVDLLTLQRVDLLETVELVHRQHQARTVLLELPQHPGHRRQQRRADETDAQAADLAARRALAQRPRLVGQREDPACFLIENLAGGREFHRAYCAATAHIPATLPASRC